MGKNRKDIPLSNISTTGFSNQNTHELTERGYVQLSEMIFEKLDIINNHFQQEMKEYEELAELSEEMGDSLPMTLEEWVVENQPLINNPNSYETLTKDTLNFYKVSDYNIDEIKIFESTFNDWLEKHQREPISKYVSLNTVLNSFK